MVAITQPEGEAHNIFLLPDSDFDPGDPDRFPEVESRNGYVHVFNPLQGVNLVRDCVPWMLSRIWSSDQRRRESPS
jgi:hypothetical protein